MLEAWLTIPGEVCIISRTSRSIRHIAYRLRSTRTDWCLEEPGEYGYFWLLDDLYSDGRSRESRALWYIESHIDTILPVSLDEEHLLTCLHILESDEIHIFLDILGICFDIIIGMCESDLVLISTGSDH